MQLEDFLNNFREQFEETSPETIASDTKYKDLDEWSSMMALIIIAFVDDQYGITLNGDDLNSTSTIEELFHRINQNL
jgi:acyl carrier protein